jgi:hypothetical protein
MTLHSNKITIEARDRAGNKIAVSLQGRVGKHKVLQLLDLIELLGGATSSVATSSS